MLYVSWLIVCEAGAIGGQEVVTSLTEARTLVWDSFRSAGIYDQAVSLEIALALAQATRDFPSRSSYESSLVRLTVTPA